MIAHMARVNLLTGEIEGEGQLTPAERTRAWKRANRAKVWAQADRRAERDRLKLEANIRRKPNNEDLIT
jgi:hypothetical protein